MLLSIRDLVMRGFFYLMMLGTNLEAINMHRDGHYNLWSVNFFVVGCGRSHAGVVKSRMLHVEAMMAGSIVVREGRHAGVIRCGHQLTALPLCSFVLKPEPPNSQYLISQRQTAKVLRQKLSESQKRFDKIMRKNREYVLRIFLATGRMFLVQRKVHIYIII